VSYVHDFFRDLDAAWPASSSPPIRLRIIGSTALMLQTDYDRGTKDSDVLESEAITASVAQRLVAIAGPGTPLAQRRRIYLEVVSSGIPFLPHPPRYRALPPLDSLRSFRIEALDVVDAVVSKLKRFSPADQEDIAAMVERGLVEHRLLVERFRSAADAFAGDARAEDLPRYVRNLHRVERDLFGVGPSEIELPEWI
jgi:hypothetical protein